MCASSVHVWNKPVILLALRGVHGCPLIPEAIFYNLCRKMPHFRASGARKTIYPLGSMYGILTYIYYTNKPNVGKYTSPMDLIGTSILHYHWFFAMSGVGYWRTPGTSCHWQTADGAQWSLRRWDGDLVCFEDIGGKLPAYGVRKHLKAVK